MRLSLLTLLLAASAFAQSVFVSTPPTNGTLIFPTFLALDPSGPCPNQAVLVVSLQSGSLFTCPGGTWTVASSGNGMMGPAGPAGAAGYSPQFITNAGAPTGITAPSANNGDMYINSTTGDLYGPLTGGTVWGSIRFNLKGPTGAAGAAGTNGTNAPGFNFRGAWAVSTNYNPLDVVTFGGSTYECSVAFTSTSTFNPSNFNLFAAAGTSGSTLATAFGNVTDGNNLNVASDSGVALNTLIVKTNNLSDLSSIPTALTNLGIGTAGMKATSFFDLSGAAATAQTNAEAASDPLGAAGTAAGAAQIAAVSTAEAASVQNSTLAALATGVLWNVAGSLSMATPANLSTAIGSGVYDASGAAAAAQSAAVSTAEAASVQTATLAGLSTGALWNAAGVLTKETAAQVAASYPTALFSPSAIPVYTFPVADATSSQMDASSWISDAAGDQLCTIAGSITCGWTGGPISSTKVTTTATGPGSLALLDSTHNAALAFTVQAPAAITTNYAWTVPAVDCATSGSYLTILLDVVTCVPPNGTGATVQTTGAVLASPGLSNASLGATEISFALVNDATGTAINKIAKMSTATAGDATINLTSNTTGAIGIVVSGAGAGTGTAQIAFAGVANCVFGDTSATTTFNDYVIQSATVNGGCTDFGAAPPTTGAQVMGRVQSTNAAPGTYAVLLTGLGNTQNVSASAINGGTLTGAAIKNATFTDTNGNTAFLTTALASATDYLILGQSTTALTAVVLSPGSSTDPNIKLVLQGKGTSGVAVNSTGLSVIHVIGTSGAPTCVPTGTNLGTGGTCTVTGTDLAGEITITTGTGTISSAAELVELTWNTAFSVKPYMQLTISNGASDGLAVAVRPYYLRSASTTAMSSIWAGSTALGASAGPYTYTYSVQQ